jgi:hypothetical protein
MKFTKPYTPFLAVFLAIVIVGFSIWKQTMDASESSDKEGLVNMEDIIERDDGVKVKRRKTSAIIETPILENYKEGKGNPFSKLGNSIKKNFKSAGKQITKNILKPITKFFKYIGDVFLSIFSYLECGAQKIGKLPQCMGWYLLEVLGHILYLPFAFFFWLFSLQSIEKMIWNVLEDIDCFFYASTGYHLIHYSDSIINKCYKCKLKKMPKFPKM